MSAPVPPLPRLSLGVTGHRSTNAALAGNLAGVTAALEAVFARIDADLGSVAVALAPTRLHNLLVDGVDQIAADAAIARGWELIAPLPFGRDLNRAINALPDDPADAEALIAGGEAGDPEVQARALAIGAITGQAQLFELAERDAVLSELFLARLRAPNDPAAVQAWSFAVSERVALASRVMIEQSDLIIGIWDGATTSFTGGTGATIALALEMGTPVLWIDARAPDSWRLLFAPEALAGIALPPPPADERDRMLAGLVQDAIGVPGEAAAGVGVGVAALDARYWRTGSARLWHGYRRVESLFGEGGLKARFRRLTQRYEAPDAIATGSAVEQVRAADSLPGRDEAFAAQVTSDILRRFAWADGISARLSDHYRGGMILNFIFSAFAIVGGIAYIPFATSEDKWIFASFELALLVGILVITIVGQRRRWHGRWFETRRVAEYLRHAPILLALGVARPVGRWPKGAHTSWPENYARLAMRGVGLPQLRVTSAYLSGAARSLLMPYVCAQRDYHLGKARRLSKVHANLDKLSEILFLLAIISVATYLTLKFGGKLHILDEALAGRLSPLLTFLGVMLPTFGAGIAGIRYFGDFERFSAISEVTAEQLDAVAGRLKILLDAPESAIDYARVAELAHAMDDIVVSEIESWQAVFAGKHITVPV